MKGAVLNIKSSDQFEQDLKPDVDYVIQRSSSRVMLAQKQGLFEKSESWETKYTVVKHRRKQYKENEMFEIYETVIREVMHQYSPTEYYANYLSKQLILVSAQETEMYRSNSVELLPLFDPKGDINGLLMMEIQQDRIKFYQLYNETRSTHKAKYENDLMTFDIRKNFINSKSCNPNQFYLVAKAEYKKDFLDSELADQFDFYERRYLLE